MNTKPRVAAVGTVYEKDHPPERPFAPLDILTPMPTLEQLRRRKRRELRAQRRTSSFASTTLSGSTTLSSSLASMSSDSDDDSKLREVYKLYFVVLFCSIMLESS